MKQFNKNVSLETKVQLPGEYGYRNIKEIHDTRNWIKIEGIEGSFQIGHILGYTNKSNVEMYPALDDLYTTDQYGAVYERRADGNHFIGKLNGRTLKKFISDQDRG